MKIFNKTLFKEGGRNPYVDWTMILTVGLISAVILIYDGITLYQRVVSGDIQSPEINNTSNIKKFSQKDFDLIVKTYQSKVDFSTQVKKGYIAYPDPSL